VQVRPTSSIIRFNTGEQDAVSAGRELQVDAVLEGNYQRLDGRLRLTVQMLQSSDGTSVWADSFVAEFEDIFDLQDRVAERVVGALRKKLSDEAKSKLTKRYTKNVEAYEEYLKGRFFYNQRSAEGYDSAIACYGRAIEIDPSYALAYAGLADIYNLLPVYDGFAPREYFPKAKAAALKALYLDGDLAEAHSALGLAILHYDWNWSGAEVSFRNAIKLDPNYANAHMLLGVFFLRVDRIGDALIALKKARELDPFSPINAVWLAEVLRHCGETETSIQLHLETLESFPEFFLAHYHLAFSYVDAGLLKEAAFHRERAVTLSRENSLTLSLQGILQAATGDTAGAQTTVSKLLQIKKEKYISSVNIASVYAAMGNEPKTLQWLETGLTERDPNLTWIAFDSEFKFLKLHPRFQTLLQEVGLAEKGAEPRQLSTSLTSKLWKYFIPVGVVAAVLVAGLGFYFWMSSQSVDDEGVALRLTNDPGPETSPRWTNDGRIRFLRSRSDKKLESVVMNADGTNQTVVHDFPDLDHGFWSPDGAKVIYAKAKSGTDFYLANADGSNETPLTFFGGNFDWSPDSQKIAYQRKVSVEDHDIFIYSIETGESENVTNNPAFDADPSFSPDGKQIVFASLRDGNAELYVENVDGSEVRRLTNHPSWDSHPVFSPDGTMIAFPSDRESEDSDVYIMRADGTGTVKRLTDWKSNEYLGPGSWSPDGTKIAFVSDRDGSDDIFVVSAEVHHARVVVKDDASDLSFPSESPDGKLIAYQADGSEKRGELRVFDVRSKQSRVVVRTENADIAPVFSPDGESICFQNKIGSNTEIVTVRPDGSDMKNLTNNAARDGGPAWSPDGKQIVFSSNRDGNDGIYNLYVMNADGSGQRQIHASKNMSLAPVWSPDGQSVVFANDKEDGGTGNFEIFRIGLASDAPEQRLTSRRRSDSNPAFSPDGRHIVFSSNTDGNTEIYVMNSDGTKLERLTRNLAEDTTPRFSSDGRRIIFSSNRGGKFALYEIDVTE
jgi:Tol biopolymer transport system component/tetratricopeptide (TPR) repeat protein